MACKVVVMSWWRAAGAVLASSDRQEVYLSEKAREIEFLSELGRGPSFFNGNF